MMQEDDAFVSTEEMMTEISLLTPHCVNNLRQGLQSELSDTVVPQHTIKPPPQQQQQSRFLRWHQQLTVIQCHMRSGQYSVTTSPDFVSMIGMISQQYEQLQMQYSNLLELLVVTPTNDNDTVKNDDNDDKNDDDDDDDNNHQNQINNNAIINTTPTKSLQSLDPLSVFVQEEDEKMKRERTIRDNYEREKKVHRIRTHQQQQHKQVYIPDEPQDPNDPSYILANAKASIQLIRKDLDRLPSPHSHSTTTATLTTTTATATATTMMTSTTTPNIITTPLSLPCRIRQLQSILYLFAISHPNAGYIQGMHEIASYCLYAVEIGMNISVPSMDHPNCNNTEALAYWFTEQILTLLYIAYDVPTTTTTTIDTSILQPRTTAVSNNMNHLLQMSNRILQYFIIVEPNLYTVLQQSNISSSIPYQLIFTKWIRLLFSRDITATITNALSVYPNDNTKTFFDPWMNTTNCNTNNCSNNDPPIISHADTVIYLWDALLDASYRMSQKQQQQKPYGVHSTMVTTTTTISSLQIVAECFCAARLWHHKYTIQHLQQHSSTTNNNYLLHWLMNVPPETMEQVQCIVLRMHYIIDRQYDSLHNKGSISDSNYNLPPFYPVSNEIYAMTHQSQAQSQSPGAVSPSFNAQTRFQPLWDRSTFHAPGRESERRGSYGIGGSSSFLHTAASAFTGATSSSSSSTLLDPSAASLSAFAESITAKTQSIQKILVKEWEQVRAHLQQEFVPEQQPSVDPIGAVQRNSTASEPSNMYNLDYYNNY